MYTNLVFKTDKDIYDLDRSGRAPYLKANHVVSRYRSCQKQKYLSLYTGHHLLSVEFTTNLQSHVCTALTRQNTT